jgi:cytochrome P450
MVRPIAFLESCRRRFGDVFSVCFLGFKSPTVMLSDPEAIRTLYEEREHVLPRGRVAVLQPLMGPSSVMLVEGDEHLARRRLMSPQLHGNRMRRYETTVEEEAERDIEGWPNGRAFAIHPHMQAVTLEVVLRVVFGLSDPARRAYVRDLVAASISPTSTPLKQVAGMFLSRLRPADPLAHIRAARSEIDRVLLTEIAERRSGTVVAEREDILSLLVAARFADGKQMSDSEICDQLVTLLVAGHETTATAIAWTIELLVHHRAVLGRLESELSDGRDAYLRAVVTESLRLRPVVPIVGRRLGSELRVDGYVLPPGTDVTPAIWLTHTRADLYSAPFSFRPERFLEHPPPAYGWLPFGGGVRRCLGAAFAEMEIRTVLKTVLRKRVLQAADPRPERVVRRNVTFSPRNGTRILAAPRAA